MENKKMVTRNYKQVNLESMCTRTASFFTPVTTWKFQAQAENGDESFHVISWIFQIGNKVYAYFTHLKRMNEYWVEEKSGDNKPSKKLLVL